MESFHVLLTCIGTRIPTNERTPLPGPLPFRRGEGGDRTSVVGSEVHGELFLTWTRIMNRSEDSQSTITNGQAEEEDENEEEDDA